MLTSTHHIIFSVKEATKEQAALQDDVDDVDNNEFESIDKLQVREYGLWLSAVVPIVWYVCA